MDDVLELRSDSKASSFTPYTELSFSPSNQNTSYVRSNSLSGKHKKLPPLSNSLGSSTNTNSKPGEEDLLHFNNLGSLLTIRSSQPSPISSLENFPDTENKKRPPQRIQAIEYRPKTVHHNTHNKQLYETVTIDILSESGRYSRQSLDPIVLADSSRSKHSHRPLSVKEPLFSKPSAKAKQAKMSKPAEEALNITSINNSREEINDHLEDDHNDDDEEADYINIESCGDENDYQTKSEHSKLDADSHLTVSKLDTINESINEIMQSNIRKLNLNEKPETRSSNSKLTFYNKTNTNNNIKSANTFRNIPKTNNIKKLSNQNVSCIKNTVKIESKPAINPRTASNCCTKPIKPVVNVPKAITNRSKSIDRNPAKPILNLDLYTPTSNRAKNAPAPTNMKPPINKSNSANRGGKTQQISEPTLIESSRILMNTKKQSLTEPPVIKLEETKEPETVVHTPPQAQSPSTHLEPPRPITPEEYTNDFEMQSMLDASETVRSNVSSAATLRTPTAAYSNRSSRFDTSLASSSVGQPTQPVIALMFEDLPQPFTSNKLINNQTTAEANKLAKKKKQTSNSNKKPSNQNNYRVRTVSANNRPVNTKPKVGPKQNGTTIKLTTSKSNEANIEIQLKNEISMYIDSDMNRVNAQNELDYLSEPEDKLNRSSNLAKSEPDLHNNSMMDLNESSIKLKADLVKSMAERVETIFNKYNELLHKQENIIIDSKMSLEQHTKNINEQKAHFSEELANELENFDAVTNDPNLARRIKEIYEQVKQNINADVKQEAKTEETSLKKDDSKTASLSSTLTAKLPSENNTLTQIESTLKKNNSIKSNADIREVFQIVSGLNKYNSFTSNPTSNLNNLEMTFPPVNHHRAKVILSKNIYQIPSNLSDKINTLITSNFQANSRDNFNLGDEKVNENNDASNSLKENKPKYNYVNSLDSTGNESNNSLASDTNSISYHYDVKYRNDGSKSPVNLLFENENEFQFKWKRGNMIGKGAFGSVYQAMLSTGAIIAVKQIEMEETDPNKARKEYNNIREEVKILRELEHINIVQFMGTMLEGNIVNIFMELIPGGTIEFLLKTYGPFEESLFRNFTNQILEGTNYIHSRNVVHRDIKGKNIMLMGNGIIKLIDFGCAKRLKKNQSSNSIKELLKSLKGTPYWMSPEVIREIGHGSKADIWSIGATVFEMSTGKPPWSEYQPIAAIYRIGSSETPVPELPEKFTPEARDFVQKCLIRNPDERPSAAELLQHDFLKQINNNNNNN